MKSHKGNTASRRSFLKASTGAALALPFLESGPARAQSANMPLRLVIYASPEGNLSRLWTPPAMPNDALQLSEMLQPLAPHQNKVTVVSGISNKVSGLHKSNGHNAPGHTLMTAELLDTTGTGAFSASTSVDVGTLSLGPSIDHYLADQLKGPAPLNFAVGGTEPAENQMWYKVKAAGAAGANPVAAMNNNPVKAFQTYLAGTSGTTMPTQTRADRFKAQRTSVLDTVWNSFKSLNAKVGTADQLRLQQHADAIRSIEKGATFMPPIACGGQTQTVPSGWTQPKGPAFAGMDVQANLMIDVIVGILACGASRIITLQDTAYDEVRFEFLPVGPVTGWHAQVHNDPALGLGYASNNDNPVLKAGFLYYATVFNRLLDRMDSVMEANGQTMLDNSLVLWISEFGNGQNHNTSNLPVVLAGGAQGKLKGNRYLQRPGTTTGDLYTSILNAFGIPATSFGYNGAAGLNSGSGIAGLFT